MDEQDGSLVHGLASVFAGAWMINLAGWNVDFAQFSPVDVPFPPPIGHIQFSSLTWFASAIVLYVAALPVLYYAGKHLPIKTRTVLKRVGRWQAVAASVYGVGVLTIIFSYLYEPVFTTFPVSYGQVWNAAHFLIITPAAVLFLFATLQKR